MPSAARSTGSRDVERFPHGGPIEFRGPHSQGQIPGAGDRHLESGDAPMPCGHPLDRHRQGADRSGSRDRRGVDLRCVQGATVLGGQRHTYGVRPASSRVHHDPGGAFALGPAGIEIGLQGDRGGCLRELRPRIESVPAAWTRGPWWLRSRTVRRRPRHSPSGEEPAVARGPRRPADGRAVSSSAVKPARGGAAGPGARRFSSAPSRPAGRGEPSRCGGRGRASAPTVGLVRVHRSMSTSLSSSARFFASARATDVGRQGMGTWGVTRP